MKKGLKIVLKIVVAVPTIGVGAAWAFDSTPRSFFFKFAFALMVLGMLMVWQMGKKYTNLIFSLSVVLWAYPLGEIVLYLKLPPQSYTGYNKECALPDSVRGYRWTAKEIRYFKTADGATVFDNYFKTNKQGWVMDQDYRGKKSDTQSKRWMLFGDSFSSGIMLKTNLANRLQERFKNDTTQNSEVYSFAVDGGGIMNWHQTFFKEVVPNYEFDGIILAVFEDNLYRDFMVEQVKPGNSFLGRTDMLDWSGTIPDFRTFPNFDQRTLVYSNEQIDEFLRNPSTKPFDWPFRELVYRLIKTPQTDVYQQRRAAKNIAQLKAKLGNTKFKMLDEMLAWCIENKKQVVLTSVPSRILLGQKDIATKNWHQQEMEIISKNWDITYFDGYNAFKGKGTEMVDKYWLKHDGHWNQQGSDLYAQSLSEFLLAK